MTKRKYYLIFLFTFITTINPLHGQIKNPLNIQIDSLMAFYNAKDTSRVNY
jgi:hypothetical protein